MTYQSTRGRRGVDRANDSCAEHTNMMRPIRAVNAWNVFAEGGDDDLTVFYRLRWAPVIGGAVKICNGVAQDWRQLSLENFARRYFRVGFAGRRAK